MKILMLSIGWHNFVGLIEEYSSLVFLYVYIFIVMCQFVDFIK